MNSEQPVSAKPPGILGAVRQFLGSPYAAAMLAMLFWAGSTIVVRYVRHEVPPMGLSFWRTVLGFVIFLPFVIEPYRRQAREFREALKILAVLSFLLMVGGNAVLFLSLQYTIAINAAVINSVEPVIIVVLAWMLFRDRFTKRQGFGVAVSLSGVLVLISSGSLEMLSRLDFNKGDLMVTGAYLSWGLYAVLVRKIPRGLDARLVLAAILGFGALFMLPVYLLETAISRPMPMSWMSVFSVSWLAVTSSVLGILMWNHAIARLGPSRAGLFLHLIPAFTVLLAIAILGEALRQFHITGIALIGIGIYFSTISSGAQNPTRH
jgi:drug/metabolite transporter (DMT)-like permease